MSLITLQSSPIVIKKNLTCYKIVEYGTLKSHGFNYYYKQNVALKSDLVLNADNTVNKGFHFMSCYELCLDLLIGNPFYSNKNNSILECEIPVGSQVYMGIHGDIASDICIVQKVINNFVDDVRKVLASMENNCRILKSIENED